MTAPKIDLPLLDMFNDGSGLRVTRNIGSRFGTVLCGDGSTSATFPTFGGGGKQGCKFDGGDYLDTSWVDPFERTDSFSIAVAGVLGLDQVVVSSSDVAASYRGISLVVNSAGQIGFALYNTLTTNECSMLTAAGSVQRTRFIVVVATYTGTSTPAGLTVWCDTVPLAAASTVNNLNATIKSGRSLLVAARHNGAAKVPSLIGRLSAVRVFNYALSPGQVAIQTEYWRSLGLG